MKTLRVFRVLRPVRIRGRMAWPTDKIVMTDREAAELLTAGTVELVEPTTRSTPWDAPMYTR